MAKLSYKEVYKVAFPLVLSQLLADDFPALDSSLGERYLLGNIGLLCKTSLCTICSMMPFPMCNRGVPVDETDVHLA